MVSALEATMDEFEAALTAVLSASHGDRRAFSPDLQQRLADSRVNVDRALTSRSGAENEFRAAVDRAFERLDNASPRTII